jgi:hypothetical protein
MRPRLEPWGVCCLLQSGCLTSWKGSRMESKRQAANEILWARTDAQCMNAKEGHRLGRYLGKGLSPKQKLAFEQHMDECLACEIAVMNWESLRKALANERAQADPAPEQKAQAFKAVK